MDTGPDTEIIALPQSRPTDAVDPAVKNLVRLKPHPLSAAFPAMSPKELKGLIDDIRTNGQRDPIVLLDGMILDGKNRYKACQALEREPKTALLGEGINAKDFVLSRNLPSRRHFRPSQVAMAVVECNQLHWARTGENQFTRGLEPGSTPPTNESMAKTANVSIKTIQQAKVALGAGLGEEVRKGLVTVKAAAEIVAEITRLPESERQSTLEAFLTKAAMPRMPRVKEKPLPTEVVVLQKEVEALKATITDHETENHELAQDNDEKTEANMELQAEVLALKKEVVAKNSIIADCDARMREVLQTHAEVLGEYALLKAKAVPDFTPQIAQAVAKEPEAEEAVEVLSAVAETPVDAAVMDDVVLEEAMDAAVDEAVQDHEPAEALLGPPSPLATHAQERLHACRRNPKHPDQYDKRTREYGLYSDAEDILKIEGRLQRGDEVSGIDRAAYYAYQEQHGLAAAAADRVVVHEDATAIPTAHVAEDALPVPLLAIHAVVAPAPMSMPPELAEASVATTLSPSALEGAVKESSEVIDHAAYLRHHKTTGRGLEVSTVTASVS